MTDYESGNGDNLREWYRNMDTKAALRLSDAWASGIENHSWWAGRWSRMLAQLLDASRLAQGRACARAGHIIHMEVQVGLILAHVQSESSPGAVPYSVRITIKTFSDTQWDRIITLMGERAIYAAQLINGEMPKDIESVFQAAGVSLFPESLQELSATCGCSEWPNNACPHTVAVYHLLGEWIDNDPFLLFVMRGRSKEQVMSALRNQRANQALELEGVDDAMLQDPSDPNALPADPEDFWRLDKDLSGIQIHIRAPEVETELLKILGELSFVEDKEIRERLEDVYQRVSRQALDTAYKDVAED